MVRTLFSIALVTLTVAFSASDSAGQTSSLGIAELTDASTLVISGRVTSVSSQWDPAVNGIYTYALVDVSEVWKGQLSARQVVVKILGGRVGDIELAIYGQARLEVDKDVALWLEVRPRDGTLYPAALAQGVRELTDSGVVDALRAIVRDRPLDTRAVTFQAVPEEWQPQVASPFAIGLPESGPVRWHEADDGTRVFVDYQPPSGYGGGVAEIDAAIVAWNTSGMRLQMQIGIQRGPRCLGVFGDTYENGGDGRISVSFNDPCGEISDSGLILGLGGGYFTTSDLRTVNGVEFKKFLQGIVMLNPAANAPALGQRGCFQEAVAHNLGHAIGLGDSTDVNAIMSADFGTRCSAVPRTLAQDDRLGARAIYPSPPGAPANLTGTASSTTVSLSWAAPTTGDAVSTYIVEAGTLPGQPFLSIPTNSTATGATFTSVPPGLYYVRVRARNAIGTSAPSNEIALAVACNAPNPPTNFAFTAVANNVNLTWTPPATGPAPTSFVLVVGDRAGAGNLLTYQFAPTTSLSATALPGTYYARLHARGVCGTSAASNEVVITLPAPCVTPSAPQSFSHTVGPNRLVTLSWAAPATGSAPFSYTIEVGSATGLSNLLITSVGGVTSVATPAPPGTYFVRVRATNACGTAGAPSLERTVVVP